MCPVCDDKTWTNNCHWLIDTNAPVYLFHPYFHHFQGHVYAYFRPHLDVQFVLPPRGLWNDGRRDEEEQEKEMSDAACLHHLVLFSFTAAMTLSSLPHSLIQFCLNCRILSRFYGATLFFAQTKHISTIQLILSVLYCLSNPQILIIRLNKELHYATYFFVVVGRAPLQLYAENSLYGTEYKLW